MADALVTGIFVTVALVLVFLIPVTLGGADGYWESKSLWEQWSSGVVILAVMIAFLAVLLPVMLGMGYFVLWFV